MLLSKTELNKLDHYQAERVEVSLQILSSVKDWNFYQWHTAKKILNCFLNGQDFTDLVLHY